MHCAMCPRPRCCRRPCWHAIATTHPFPSETGNLDGAARRPLATLGVAASFALVALIFAFWKMPAAATNAFETEIGENRSVALADGSIISLGGDTRIEVAMSENVRAIELVRGEALFKVAKDSARPFKVRAGDATIIAVGTEFNVERDSDRAVVSVTEGRVVVKPGHGSAAGRRCCRNSSPSCAACA